MNFSKTKKGQPAVEALMILSISIVFIIPLAILFYSSAGLRLETLNYMEAKAFSQHIVDTAGEVWYAGKGARKTLIVNYPNGMTDIKLSGDDLHCPLVDGAYICPKEIKYMGRELTITFNTDTGLSAQTLAISPAPMKNRISNPAQSLEGSQPAGGTINSGLVVLVFKNEGPYVNVVRYTPRVIY